MVYENIPRPPDMPEGWAVRFIQDGDEEAILSVLQDAFPRWPRFDCSVSAAEHLEWKLHAHPQSAKFHLIVTSPQGIVGARLEWAFDTKVGEKTYLVREPIDRAVRPHAQRQYAMSAMRTFGQEARDKSFDMYVGYGSGAPGLQHFRKYRVPSERYRRTLDVMVCDLRDGVRDEGEPACEVLQVDAFDERADALWSNAKSQFQFAVVRSSARLNWRYIDPRAGIYTVFVAQEGDRWLGYAVLRAQGKAGYIADLFALPDSPETLESLLNASIRHLQAQGTERVECWSEPHHVYRWSLDKAGFRTPRRTINLTFRPTRCPAEEAAFLDDPAASVLFTMGDTDLV